MREAYYFKQFQRDVKLQKKRGKNLEKLKIIIEHLIEEKPLPEKTRDHILVGNFAGCRECHIEPDWLLIYQLEEMRVYFMRTGTHSDLFG